MSRSETILRQADAERDYYYNDDFIDILDDVVFDRTVITRQPFADETRQPLPISTVNHRNNTNVHLLPISGIALLFDVAEVTLEQTVELSDLVSLIESESRYLVKTAGQILFGGVESSSSMQRLFCGSGRRFTFRLFDRSRQEALYMTRRLACANPLLGCYLQRIDVFEPPCEFIGCVQQEVSYSNAQFVIRDGNNMDIYSITGPSFCCCTSYREITFPICDNVGHRVATITHEWDSKILGYKLTLIFPTSADSKDRALLLSSAVLLEFMYFQISKSNSMCCFNCHK